MTKLIQALLLLILCTKLSLAVEAPRTVSTIEYLAKREHSTKVGAIFHYTGALRYSNMLLLSQLEDDWGYIGYYAASGRKIHGDIMAGVAATRACRMYNKTYSASEEFSWKYYIAGASSYVSGFTGLTLVMGTKLPREVGITLFISGITACEILTTIHIIKARRVTKSLLDNAKGNSPKVSWGVFPTFSDRGGGVSLLFLF